MSARRPLFVAFVLLAGCKAESPTGDDAANTEATSEATSAGTTATTGTDTSDTETTGEPVVDPVLEADDFGCILDFPKVHRFRITNVLGNLDASLAVANSPDGGEYPIGTLIQLIPTEAMVKRAPGFEPAAKDWEFFSLAVDAQGTEILDRGAAQVVNQFGGNCFDCHAKAAPQWDFVCEQDHGCDPLPFTEAQIEAVQNADPRCP